MGYTKTSDCLYSKKVFQIFISTIVLMFFIFLFLWKPYQENNPFVVFVRGILGALPFFLNGLNLTGALKEIKKYPRFNEELFGFIIAFSIVEMFYIIFITTIVTFSFFGFHNLVTIFSIFGWGLWWWFKTPTK